MRDTWLRAGQHSCHSPPECAAPIIHLTVLCVQVGADRLRGALQVGDAVAAISLQLARRAGAAMSMLRAAVGGRPGMRAMVLLHLWHKATQAARLGVTEQDMVAHAAGLAAHLHRARGTALRMLWAEMRHRNMLRHCVLAWVRGSLRTARANEHELAAQCRGEQEARGRLQAAQIKQQRQNDAEKRKQLQEEAEHAKAEEVRAMGGRWALGRVRRTGHVGHTTYTRHKLSRRYPKPHASMH